MDKKQQVEYSYVAFYGVFLIVAVGFSWVASRIDRRTYRHLLPPIGLLTGLMILGGILLAQHHYPGG